MHLALTGFLREVKKMNKEYLVVMSYAGTLATTVEASNQKEARIKAIAKVTRMTDKELKEKMVLRFEGSVAGEWI